MVFSPGAVFSKSSELGINVHPGNVLKPEHPSGSVSIIPCLTVTFLVHDLFRKNTFLRSLACSFIEDTSNNNTTNTWHKLVHLIEYNKHS